MRLSLEIIPDRMLIPDAFAQSPKLADCQPILHLSWLDLPPVVIPVAGRGEDGVGNVVRPTFSTPHVLDFGGKGKSLTFDLPERGYTVTLHEEKEEQYVDIELKRPQDFDLHLSLLAMPRKLDGDDARVASSSSSCFLVAMTTLHCAQLVKLAALSFLHSQLDKDTPGCDEDHKTPFQPHALNLVNPKLEGKTALSFHIRFAPFDRPGSSRNTDGRTSEKEKQPKLLTEELEEEGSTMKNGGPLHVRRHRGRKTSTGRNKKGTKNGLIDASSDTMSILESPSSILGGHEDDDEAVVKVEVDQNILDCRKIEPVRFVRRITSTKTSKDSQMSLTTTACEDFVSSKTTKSASSVSPSSTPRNLMVSDHLLDSKIQEVPLCKLNSKTQEGEVSAAPEDYDVEASTSTVTSFTRPQHPDVYAPGTLKFGLRG
ncbi:unnamed protein product [Amoebophrya sp. A25]|nr:unnamed protein product [Amoebophrya sp. A25]|eukprot:GSA25T00008355001.1